MVTTRFVPKFSNLYVWPPSKGPNSKILKLVKLPKSSLAQITQFSSKRFARPGSATKPEIIGKYDDHSPLNKSITFWYRVLLAHNNLTHYSLYSSFYFLSTQIFQNVLSLI